MIVDSSAVVAVLKGEHDTASLLTAMASAPASISAATVLEASIVAGPARHGDLDEILTDIEVVPFDAAQAAIARDAYRRFGKGSGSRARLNFGDCFSYALAKATGEPLLFKGDDFTHTDVEPALPPSDL